MSENVNRIPQAPQLNLARRQFDRPLFVDMEAFFDFSFWIAEELLDLETAYQEKHAGRLANQNQTFDAGSAKVKFP